MKRARRAVPILLAVVVVAYHGRVCQARSLTLEERIEAQRAVEQVLWSHRIWPEGNPGPKPPLAAVLPEEALRAKVEKSLAASARLAAEGTALRGEDLQAEIDRMARDTRSPSVLRELFAALRNDPALIAECLARPLLAERREAAARPIPEVSLDDPASAGGGETSLPFSPIASADLDPPKGGYRVPEVPLTACAYDTWAPTSMTNAPTGREDHTAVWTGTEMIVWGGLDSASALTNTGARYVPATDSWTATSIIPSTPAPRRSHSAVWTGTEMIVWGGMPNGGGALNTGARYSPAADSWVATSLGANLPSVRLGHAAVWTGTQMVVWGGFGGVGGVYPNTGGRYDPSTNTWTTTSLANVPTGRYLMSAVWTGFEMIVWGGATAVSTNTGGRYNPSTDSWTATSTGLGVPPPSILHTAVWTGSQMLVFSNSANPVGTYNPSTDQWFSSGGAPGRQAQVAVWTGFDMIVWSGGVAGQNFTNTGARWAPGSGWETTSLTTGAGANVPTARRGATAVYTGSSDKRMIVWGGIFSNNARTATGGLYCAADCDMGSACNDNSVCTTTDSCTLGHCTGPQLNCADSDFCTLDTCDALAGCQHACTASCIPGEIAHLAMNPNRFTITWDYTSGGSQSIMELARGRCDQFPVGGGAAETCLQFSYNTYFDDLEQPPAGRAFWYDVRGRHQCGAGPYGSTSGGAPRTTSICP